VGAPNFKPLRASLVAVSTLKGVLATKSTFSAQAVEFAARIPQRVILIDGKRLTEVMIKHSVDVRSSRVLEFKRLDEDFFTDE
jgi:restriction system protein